MVSLAAGFDMVGSSCSNRQLIMVRLIASVFLLIAATKVASVSAQVNAPRKLDRPNILWLTAEDIGPHLGCYGDSSARTPNLDQLAKEGMIYKTAWSNYPVCASARTTLITGAYASTFAAGHMRCQYPLPKTVRMFPELLRKAGYFCTNQSKEDFNLRKNGKVWDQLGRNAHYKRRGGKPFFSVFNFTGTHESQIRNKPQDPKTDPKSIQLPPYYPDHPKVRRDWAHYYDNISKLDRWVARKLEELEDAGLKDDTIVFFFGDHGSGMPRHKRYAGGSGMRVPLLVFVPPKYRSFVGKEFQSGSKTDRLAGFVDLAPTVLKLAGVESPAWMQGSDLFAKKKNEKSSYLYGFRSRMDETVDCSRSMTDGRFVYIKNFYPFLPHGQFVSYQQKTPTTSLWYQQFHQRKLNSVQSRFWEARSHEELYDLKSDPHETRNLARDANFSKVLNRFRKKLYGVQTTEIFDAEMVPESWVYQNFRNESFYDFVRTSKGRQMLRKVVDAAWKASALSADQVPGVLESIQKKGNHTAVKMWLASGLVGLNSEVDRFSKTAVDLLKHSSPMVRCYMAEWLLDSKEKANRQKATEVLFGVAQNPGGNYYASVWALGTLLRNRSRIATREASRRLAESDESKKQRSEGGGDSGSKKKRKVRGKGYWSRLKERWNGSLNRSIGGKPWKRFVVGNSYSGADGVRLGDLNQDGLLDVVTGFEEGGKTAVFYNPGPGKSKQTWPMDLVGNAPQVEDAFPVDIDQDGFCEVVSSTEGNDKNVYVHKKALKDGKHGWTTMKIPAADGRMKWMYAESLQLDQKNGIDLIVGGKGQGAQIGWFQSPKNPRDLADWVWYPISKVSWVMSVRCIDMDCDGDRDVLLTDRKRSDLQGCRWLENPGKGPLQKKAWKSHFVGCQGEELGFLDVADIDSDGLLDVLAANMSRKTISLMKKVDRSGVNWQRSEIELPEAVGRPKAVRVGDIDQDGDLDIVYSSNTLKKDGAVGMIWISKVVENGETNWRYHHLSGSAGYKFDRIELLDLDGDGDLDVLTTEENYGPSSHGLGVVWYQNPTR